MLDVEARFPHGDDSRFDRDDVAEAYGLMEARPGLDQRNACEIEPSQEIALRQAGSLENERGLGVEPLKERGLKTMRAGSQSPHSTCRSRRAMIIACPPLTGPVQPPATSTPDQALRPDHRPWRLPPRVVVPLTIADDPATNHDC